MQGCGPTVGALGKCVAELDFMDRVLLFHTVKELNIRLAARDARPPIGVGLGPFC